MNAPETSFDPITLEVLRNALEATAQEMGAVLKRTAFSPNIKERMDASCAIFDANAQLVAQAEHVPVHLGSMLRAVSTTVARFDELAEGDVLLVNDPFVGGSHLPDVMVIAPVFHHSALIGYAATRAHQADIGGMEPGSMPGHSHEIYQEGLIIPPIKLARRGEIVEDVLKMILANVRTPDEREGDLTAQIAANRVADTRLRDIVAKYGRRRVDSYASALQDYTERVLRATIAAIPDGTYTFEDWLDDDGFNDVPIAIRVAIRIAGDTAVVDFAGSDPQTTGGVNANFAITFSATLYGFRCLVEEDVLYNAGIARVVRITAPEGSIANATRPSAVAGGNVETSQRITDVILGALSRALPDRIPAASQGTMNNVTLGGVDPRTGRRFAYYETIGGGMGARHGLDGISGVHTHMSNTRNTPVEALEHYLPVRIRHYGLRQGSGGAGRWRGGDGIVREYEMLTETAVTVLSDRRRGAPYGAAGGNDGTPGRNTAIRAGRAERLPGKFTLTLAAGDRLRIESPGGGGYGSVAERS